MKPRENPFSTERVSELRYRLEGTCGSLLERLHALGARASIVGQHGNGKTTLVEDLEQYLQSRGFTVMRLLVNQAYSFIPHAFWHTNTKGVYVLLDGKERLPWVVWIAFQFKCRDAAGVVIVEHEPGRWPILHECKTTFPLFESLIDQMLNAEHKARLPAGFLEQLFSSHGGNIRDCMRDLYDYFADLPRSEACQ
ncbi:hypothetical protein KF728_26305 [Candidatus Obscuribacterales bacterium]|nr:hypothetical protein [Candidatus Obscuribacterales bacterium]MBX3153693.1 hypothetical protein [Candidatus Obscuribacterales bacterium]